MVPFQLAKLKKDSQELEHFIARMKKEGRSDKATQLLMKKAHIDSYIEKVTKKEFNYQ
jgi:hypothetical protein